MFKTSLALFLAMTAAAQQSEVLRIVVVEGDNARHNIRTHAVSPTVVEVRDGNNRPLAGAHVEFELPSLGPGGHFADGSRKLTMIADSQGRATMLGFVPNDQEGEFRVVIRVSSETASNSVGIVQHNMTLAETAPPYTQQAKHSGAGTKLLLLVVIGAAAAAGGIAASKAGSSSSSSTIASAPSASATIGTVTVGGPH